MDQTILLKISKNHKLISSIAVQFELSISLYKKVIFGLYINLLVSLIL